MKQKELKEIDNMISKIKCPICGKEIDNINYFETDVKEPFEHFNPIIGLTIYGPLDAKKEIICQNENYIHFKFVDNNEERLVKLGCADSDNDLPF